MGSTASSDGDGQGAYDPPDAALLAEVIRPKKSQVPRTKPFEDGTYIDSEGRLHIRRVENLEPQTKPMTGHEGCAICEERRLIREDGRKGR